MEKYIDKQFPINNFKKALDNDTTGNPFNILNSMFNFEWSYAIKNVNDTKEGYTVTVTIYMPGTIRDGIGTAKSIENAIALSLLHVIKTIDPSYKTPKEKGIPNQVDKTVTNQSDKVILTGYQPKVNTVNSTPPTSGPSINVAKDINAPTTKEVKSTLPPVNAPIAKSTVITEEQKLKQLMDKFKITVVQASGLLSVHAKYKISKMSTLLRYLQAFNPSIKSIDELNNNNIDAFIAWAKGLEEGFKVEEELNETLINA